MCTICRSVCLANACPPSVIATPQVATQAGPAGTDGEAAAEGGAEAPDAYGGAVLHAVSSKIVLPATQAAGIDRMKPP
ncbi:hypothetical protein Apa02nite_003890 [Actinoplanes palleronii]|uniref:Uncharacterized protein n=1 Tax=Actinoplanes palleronii TaxID=113570 RepID=A0ABQ4B0U1_9ACTN|nr:hypothetical protein Apa02nite_003890 [Actinoplanes palleronii]